MAANQTLTLEASIRETGKHNARSLRKDKKVPAVVYGPKTTPLSLFISEIDAVRYNKHGFENSIFTITSKDKDLDGMKVLKKSVDIHPLSRRPVHMDFFAPDMTQTVRVEVEVRLNGKAIGTTEGGLVSQVRRTVEIECLPLEIPEFFELDITNLGLNESLHVSDLGTPSNFKMITATGETIASCAVVTEEEAAPTPAAADAAAGTAAAPGAAPAAGTAAPAAAAPSGDKKS
jgi:large subunit ribosomal protein L25